MLLKPGQIIRFTYHHKKVDQNTGDKYKEILVLHPSWEGKVHGIDLKRISPAEREVLMVIMSYDGRRFKSLRYQGEFHHKIPLVNDILNRMNPRREAKNPRTFYAKFVKPFLHKQDAYRTYFAPMMSGVSVVTNKTATGQPDVANPLFPKKELEPEPTPVTPTTPAQQKVLTPAQQRLAALQQRGRTPPGQMAARPAQPSRPSTPSTPATPARPATPGAVSQGVLGAAARLAALKARAKK